MFFKTDKNCIVKNKYDILLLISHLPSFICLSSFFFCVTLSLPVSFLPSSRSRILHYPFLSIPLILHLHLSPSNHLSFFLSLSIYFPLSLTLHFHLSIIISLCSLILIIDGHCLVYTGSVVTEWSSHYIY